MPRPSFAPGRPGATLLASLLLAGTVAVVPMRGVAAAWEPTGLAERTFGLHAPTSGALFARTESGLHRSDDGGASWRPVPLPPAYAGNPSPPPVVVDPVNHTRMFAGGWVTRDDGATWSPLGSWPAEAGESARLEVSPADPNLLYLALTSGGMGTGKLRMLRSRDGGGSWEQILALGPGDFRPSSVMTVTLFEAHYSDPNVLFQSVGGFRGSGNQSVLRRSADQGQTFQEVLFSTLRIPGDLVGGRGAAPGRFYAGLRSSEAPSVIFRSDDGGVSWVEVGTFGSASETVAIQALAYDPAAPDRVYVGLNTGGVRSSEDGGQTWTDLGLADQTLNSLVLGVDGRNLYAATDRGLFRLPLR